MSTPKIADLLARNRKYVESHPHVPNFLEVIPAVRQARNATVVVCCSDPRLDIKQIFGVYQEPRSGPLFSILTPGGRAHMLIEPIAAVQRVCNPGTIIVMHHSDCGMFHVRDKDVKQFLLEVAPEDKEKIEAARFGEIDNTDIEVTIKEDVEFLRNSSWVKKDIDIVGLKYDLHTGVVEQVV